MDEKGRKYRYLDGKAAIAGGERSFILGILLRFVVLDIVLRSFTLGILLRSFILYIIFRTTFSLVGLC